MKKNLQIYIIIIICIIPLIAIAPGTEHYLLIQNQKPFQNDLKIMARMPPPGETKPGKLWHGNKGITETINEIMNREQSNPFIYTGPHLTKEEEETFEHEKYQNPLAPSVSKWPPSNEDHLNIHKEENEKNNPQTVGVTFDGPQLNEAGYIPPDNMGDVGPTQILAIANGRIKVFDKTGVLGSLNTTTDNFFNSVRNSSGTSDPHIRYDRLSQRWFITMINVSTPNRVLIAVSSGSTISNSSSFTFYEFAHDSVGTIPNADSGDFADYDTFGVDRYALYIGVNVFNSSLTAATGTTGFVVNKASLLSGTLTVTPFRQLTNTLTTGPWTPQGVNNDDPNAAEGYFIGIDYLVYSQLDIRRISNPGGTPSISGNITLTVPATYSPIPQSALGTSTHLDAVDDRLFAAYLHYNKISGTQSLWTAHNIRVNSSGVASSSGDRNGSRWYEITNLTGTPTLNQSGTLYDNSSSNVRGFWMPSVAMSGQGHMALGCSTAGTSYYAEVAASGRYYTDAPGTIQSYLIAQTTTHSYDITVTNPQRWGDFTQVNLDPNDDMTMWTVQEYCNATNSWCERVIQLKAPPPATPISATSVSQGYSSVNSTVTGSIVSGSGFFDPGSDANGPGYSNHISASVSGGVIVNSVTFNSTTQVTLNLNTTGATTGSKDVTITNPDGQSVTGSGILNVTPPLPVLISSFASNVLGRDIILSWTTTLEINNSGFNIERKKTDSQLWESIGFVNGNGTSYSPHSYQFSDNKLSSGNYQYRLKQIDYNGDFQYFNLNNIVSVGIPNSFSLSQNYPNPSNPVSKIDYQIPINGNVNITVFDATGKEVKVLVNETLQAGYYTTLFDGSQLASGIYYYRIHVAGSSQTFTKTLKLVLLK